MRFGDVLGFWVLGLGVLPAVGGAQYAPHNYSNYSPGYGHFPRKGQTIFTLAHYFCLPPIWYSEGPLIILPLHWGHTGSKEI